MKRLLIAFFLTGTFVFAGPATPRWLNRYILILEDAPLAQGISTRSELRSKAAAGAAARIQSAQRTLKAELANRKIKVIGAVQTLLNAVIVAVPEDGASALAGLPGVQKVIQSRPLKLHMNKAGDLVNAPQAWGVLGGQASAGAGVKIGIIDTGIDQNHPAFKNENTGMQAPANYPPQDTLHRFPHQSDTAFTNGKVIVARSYVEDVAAGFNDDPATDSRPDDYSARDRIGHGTAVAMIAAGATNTAPNGTTITGIAPKAWLGNYKVYGSPGLNETTFDDVVVMALEDAYNDGMDVVLLAEGALALLAPRDKGAKCSTTNPDEICDVRATAVENAITNADGNGNGMTVVLSAGNDGDIGRADRLPTRNTLSTPGTAPSGITVGATTNAHNFFSTVTVAGDGAPAGIQARLGDGVRPASPLTAPLRDIAAYDGNGFGCGAINGNLAGAIVLIQRGSQCGFETKVLNAQKAGAAGVILYETQDRNYVIQPASLVGTGIPAVMINYTDGSALKSYVAGHQDAQVTIDPALREVADQPDTVAFFSSRGPSIADASLPEGIKPELVAPGVGVYTATQSYDPSGDLYSKDGYTAVQGTSYSAAFVAGAAALVKQKNMSFRPAQVKSAVVNTATASVLDGAGPASVTAVGAGKLNAQAAVQTTVTVEPSTVSFGVLTATSLPITRALTITNAASAAVHLTFDITTTGTPDARANVSVLTSSLDLQPGASQQVSVRLAGSLPAAGSYEGAINVRGGAVPLRVPFLYQVGDAVPYDVFAVAGFDFIGNPNQLVPTRFIGLRLMDRYGVPVYGYAGPGIAKPGLEVAFRPTLGGGHMWNVPNDPQVDPATDVYGIAIGLAVLGPTVGEQEFVGSVAGMNVTFGGIASNPPAINAGGVLNAASSDTGNGLAPGSYISIYGTDLATTLKVFNTNYLPPSLAGVSVSFDIAGQNPGWPGRIHFVSPGQVNVQIPWELAGKSTAKMKVAIVRNHADSYDGALYNLNLAPASPGIFEIPDPTGGTVAAALDSDYKIVTSSNPIERGKFLQLYVNGLGPVTNQPPSGEATPVSPLSYTTLPVVVILCGQAPVTPAFSGLSPGSVGLYQINVQVPQSCGTGMQQVSVAANGVTSKTVRVPMK